MTSRFGGHYGVLAAAASAFTAFLVIAAIHLDLPWVLEAVAVAAATGVAVAAALAAVSGALRRQQRAVEQVRREVARGRRDAHRAATTAVTTAAVGRQQLDASVRSAADRVAERVRRATAQDMAEIEALLQLLPLAANWS